MKALPNLNLLKINKIIPARKYNNLFAIRILISGALDNQKDPQFTVIARIAAVVCGTYCESA